MRKETALTALLLVLLAASVLQAVQLSAMNSDVQKAELSKAAYASQQQSGSGSSSESSGSVVPKNLQNLPSMVGGC